MNNIKFSKNWNNKLDCDYFTTIRLYEKQKFDYYYNLYETAENVGILLKDQEKCIGRIVDIDVKLMKDIPDPIMMTDVGDSTQVFQNLMESMYKNKPEFHYMHTRFIILTIKKLHDGT